MRVVKFGAAPAVWPREFECPHCKSVLALDRADVKRNTDYLGDFSSYYIDCPVCFEQPDVPTEWWALLHRTR